MAQNLCNVLNSTILFKWAIISFSFLMSHCNAITATVGIDWGEEFIKVSIGYRGHKPDILLSDTGSRKFQNVVYLGGEVRSFDAEAATTCLKQPSTCFQKYAHLIGQFTEKSCDTRDSEANLISTHFSIFGKGFNREYFPFDFHICDGELHATIRKDTTATLEEIAGHFLNYIRLVAVGNLRHAKLVKDDPEETVVLSTVLAIPCHYTQKQRCALRFAATSAGLQVVGIVHGVTAAAYMRSLEAGPLGISLFIDIGSFGATIGVFDVNSTDAVKEAHVKMLYCASLQDVGGRAQDLLLADYLRKIFETKNEIKLSEHPRALQKLLKAANKAKTTLTISSRASVSIEGLVPFKDFNAIVEREEFEKLLVPIVNDLNKLVDEVLEKANIKLSDVKAVELIGGAWRVPLVQTTLAGKLAPVHLGYHLNAEEAVAMGTGYLAAAHNPFFKVKKCILSDAALFTFKVRVVSLDPKLPNAIDETSVLHSSVSNIDAIKNVKLKTGLDLMVEIMEDDSVIDAYTVHGVAKAYKQMLTVDPYSLEPTVHLVISGQGDGILTLVNAFVSVPVVKDQEKPLETDNTQEIIKDKTLESATETKESATETKESATETKESATETKESATETKEPNKNQLKEEQVALEIKRTICNFTKPDKLEKTKDAIESMHKRDVAINHLSTQRNMLESLIYRYKSTIKSGSMTEHATIEELGQLQSVITKAEEWFDENAYSSTLDKIQEEIVKIESLALPILERKKSQLAFANYLINTTKAIQKIQETLSHLETSKPFIKEDHADSIAVIQDILKWWNEYKEMKQTDLKTATTTIDLKLGVAKEAIETLNQAKRPNAEKTEL